MTCNRCQELSEALEDSRREADTLREALRLVKEELSSRPVLIPEDIGRFQCTKYAVTYGGKGASTMREQAKWDTLVGLGWEFARARFQKSIEALKPLSEMDAMPVIFQGRAWKRTDAVNPHTCEGCHAQKADGVPCGVNGDKTPPPCGDGILVRWQEGGAA